MNSHLPHTPFGAEDQQIIERVAQGMRGVYSDVTVEYGETDEGDPWAVVQSCARNSDGFYISYVSGGYVIVDYPNAWSSETLKGAITLSPLRFLFEGGLDHEPVSSRPVAILVDGCVHG